jgi:predicted ATP-grasp superfamily ATP-dependent carboligase
VVLVHGIEPNMRWRAFSEELVQGLESLGVEMVILLGALLADAPHTRPVPVSVGSSSAKLASEVAGVGRVDYKGPTGIIGVLQHTCTGAGLPTVSLWAQVPHYVAQPPSPKATLALLRGVEDILDAPLPLADLPEEARAWERGVDELAQQDSEVAEYVRTLEEAKDAMDLPEASGDAIAREFERYFRRRGAGGSPGPGGI